MPHDQIFLFVNPSSGGGKAAAYTKLEKEHVRVNDCNADLFIYNIRQGDSGRKPGFMKIRDLIESKSIKDVIHVMVAGGDGTVMWALSEMIATDIDMTMVAVGVIPFGTGNDFARCLKWGSDPAGDLASDAALARDMRVWLKSNTCDFDLWEVEVETDAGGEFLFVHDKQKAMTEGDRLQHNIKNTPSGGLQMKKPMCNYFSTGFGERVGLGFEKNRTSSKTGNNVRYGWEGLKKTLFTSPLRVDEVVQSIQIGEKAVNTISLDHNDLEHKRFKQSTRELLFINIPSFAGGCDPWHLSEGQVGLGHADSSECAGLKVARQSFGDGKIEVLAFNSRLGFQKDVMQGKLGMPFKNSAQRISQDKGPFQVNFKKDCSALHEGERVYFQIDGEFFAVTRPKSVTVRHYRTVRVLKN